MRNLMLAASVAAAAMLAEPGAQASTSKQQQAAARDCGSFFECLFNDRRPARPAYGAQKSRGKGGISNPAIPNRSVPDRSTAQTVSWTDSGKYKPGTIVVRTPERRLYYVLGNGKAVRYAVGVGREGFQWSGKSRIVAKQEWPDWHPPKEMIARDAALGIKLPDMMDGGPDNPLGARAMYIGGTMFRIHGTNNPGSIGGFVSSGCIRMMNSDVTELYGKVRVGTPIFVYQ